MVRTSSALIVALMSVSWSSAMAQTQGQPTTPASVTQPSAQQARKGYWVQTSNGWRVAKPPTIDLEELAAIPRPDAVRPGQPAPIKSLTNRTIDSPRTPVAVGSLEASTPGENPAGFEIKPIEAAPVTEAKATKPAMTNAEKLASEFETKAASEVIKPAPTPVVSKDTSIYERPTKANEVTEPVIAKVEVKTETAPEPAPQPKVIAKVETPAEPVIVNTESAPEVVVAATPAPQHEVILPQGPMIPVPPLSVTNPAFMGTIAEAPAPVTQPVVVHEPVAAAPSAPVTEPAPVVVESAKMPEPAAKSEPATAVAHAEPVKPADPIEVKVEAKPEPQPEPVVVKVEPVAVPEMKPEVVAKAEPVTAPAPEVKVEPTPEAKTEVIAAKPTEPAAKAEANTEPKPIAMPSMVTEVAVVAPAPPATATLDPKPAPAKPATTPAVAKAEPAKPNPTIESKALRNQLKAEPVTVRVTAAEGPEGQIQGRIIDNGTALDWTNLGSGLEGSGVIELRTGAAGELQLVMDEAATVQIGAMSTATLKKSKLGDGSTKLFVELRRGKATVTPIKAGTSVNVLTPTELVSVKERTEVRFDAAFGTRVQTLEVATPQNTQTTP